jgi:hypothetical protein
MSPTPDYRASKDSTATRRPDAALTQIAFVLACALVIARATFLRRSARARPRGWCLTC